MPIPEIVGASVGTVVTMNLPKQTLYALAVGVILFYIIVRLLERS